MASHSDKYSLIIPGIISSISSFLILFTCIFLFPELKKLRYIELVLYVSINDFIASVAMSLGPSKDGSAACWFQGLSSNFNFISAVFWATVISYQVYLVVLHGTILKDLTLIHYICWGIPLLMTILPLSTDTYGTYDNDNWCFIKKESNSKHPWTELFWAIMSFYIWVWLAIIFNFFMIGSISWKLYKMREIPDIIWDSFIKLSLYPVVISICWIPASIVDMLAYTQGLPNNNEWNSISLFSTVLSISQGFFFACIFFTLNPIVHSKFRLICSSNGSNKSNVEKDRISSIEMFEAEIDHIPNKSHSSVISLSGSRSNSNFNSESNTSSSIDNNMNPIFT